MKETERFKSLTKQYEISSLLRIATAGSVDDGKSTLLGRLLYDTNNIYEDTLGALERASKKDFINEAEIDLALVTDGLKSEREQGITIDVAHRYFFTPKRKFILADSPGHEQYTRNMATAASKSDVAIILIDAQKGVLPQSKRHSFICALLGIKHFVVAVNKMDLIDYSEEKFNEICSSYKSFAKKLVGPTDIRFIPISALVGDNVCQKSESTKWYDGQTLLNYLETVFVEGDRNFTDFRFPVQTVIKKESGGRLYAGQLASGVARVGDQVVVMPSGYSAKILEIFNLGVPVEKAFPPMSVTLGLDQELDVGRGDLFVYPNNRPKATSNLEAMFVWMDSKPLDIKRKYVLHHGCHTTKCFVSDVLYKVDVNSLSRKEDAGLGLNEIARICLETQEELFWDPFLKNRQTGCFILVDQETNAVSGAGMILDRGLLRAKKGPSKAFTSNVQEESGYIANEERQKLIGQRGLTVWISGLSGSGKSTLAKEIDKKLHAKNIKCFPLDGDNLRLGLNSNLGFSIGDRGENIRRAAEVARILNQSGIIVLSAFITPRELDRDKVRSIIGAENLIEVFVDTPLEECVSRDTKGLYKKAMAGEIPSFTGISSPFESPKKSDFHFKFKDITLDSMADRIAEKIISLSEL